MRPEQLSAPAGSPPFMAAFTQSLIRVLQAMSGSGEPKRLAVYADIASAPPASAWQHAIAIAEDGDGLGNARVIWSDGTNWTAL
ncbi:MAG TPA: hypothetical protein DCL48_08990 [Alphaproteobacteria bacterium]|nr:hypothetical protein [Alphaproteobacteria bacterium]